ncbi:MAG: Kynurenine formamidase [Oscillospiraceae bacterium]|jgi:arylformamidase
MKLIDITNDLFSSDPYPGDPAPRREFVRRMDLGDEYNLSGFYACCHNATHLDAPLHFIADGDSIDKVELSRCIGPCKVIPAQGILTGKDIDHLAPKEGDRFLFQGNGTAFLSQSAAFALADAGVSLVGTDAQSIGAPDDEHAPHVELLSAGIPILEGLNLACVEPGEYRLIALPLLLSGAEASPVRAVLIKDETP